MDNINRLYGIAEDMQSKEAEPADLKAIDSEMKKTQKEILRNSLRREKYHLPMYLRRINLIWEIILFTVIIVFIFGYSGNKIYNYVKLMTEITDTSAHLKINESDVDTKSETVTVNGRTYIKLPYLCEVLSCDYEQVDIKNIKLMLDGKEYYISADSVSVDVSQTGSNEIISNLTLSKKAFLYKSSIYIYVRDLSLFMPINTSWDANSKTIIIKSI